MIKLNVGARSVLWGAHQFLIHPLYVAAAWCQLYGFPRDWRLWCAFFLHDLGHLFYNSPDMDGEAGERHVFWGAKVMAWLCDGVGRDGKPRPGVHYEGWTVLPDGFWLGAWGQFCLFHSRFIAKQYGYPYSPLCVADKLACALEPAWLYLPRVILSGEVKEYMALAGGRGSGKYKGEPNSKYVVQQLNTGTIRGWHAGMTTYLREWVAEHRDGREDTWTPAPVEATPRSRPTTPLTPPRPNLIGYLPSDRDLDAFTVSCERESHAALAAVDETPQGRARLRQAR